MLQKYELSKSHFNAQNFRAQFLERRVNYSGVIPRDKVSYFQGIFNSRGRIL